MTKVDIEALLAGKISLLRTKPVEVDGLGSFEIHEFSASALQEALKSIAQGDENGVRHYAGLVLRFLKGEAYEPTEDEIDAILQRVGSAAINKLLEAGIAFEPKEEQSQLG